MGALLSAPLSCLGSLCGSLTTSLACSACKGQCVTSKKAASGTYIMLIAVTTLVALAFAQNKNDIVLGGSYNKTESDLIEKIKNKAISGAQAAPKNLWNQRFWCAPKHPNGWVICCEDTCGGVFSVYRFSWAIAIFFALMMVLTIRNSRFGAKVHRGYWFAKFATIFALLVASLFVSNDYLVHYREVARYLSFFFLFIQILLLIDFGYSWNEKWLTYDENSDDDSLVGWRLAIVASAFLLYIASIIGWVLMYVHFGHEGCPGQQTVISLSLIGALLLTGVSISRIAPHGALLTSAVVTSYCTYLTYSALASHPDKSCNPYAADGDAATVLFGLLVAAISVASTAWNVTGSKAALLGTKEDGTGEMSQPLDKPTSDSDPKDDSSDDDEVQAESWWYFHAMMCACALYLSMLLTDWSRAPAEENGVPVSGSTPIGKYSVGLESFWVKVVSMFVCLCLYAWTLLAPYLLRESRDFGVEFDF